MPLKKNHNLHGNVNILYLWKLKKKKKKWQVFFYRTAGPCCSKLTMSSFNVSLKLWSLNMTNKLLVCWKNVNSFCICICKSYSYFFSKNTCELYIVLTRKVNILITNELVKLTTLWTTGPWCISFSRYYLLFLEYQPIRFTAVDSWDSFFFNSCNYYLHVLAPRWAWILDLYYC